MLQLRVAEPSIAGLNGFQPETYARQSPATGAGAPCPSSRCASCAVRALSVCSALATDELTRFEQMAETTKIPAGETVFIEGEPAASVYNVKAGTLRLYRILPDGRRQIVGFMTAGDFVGLTLAERYAYSADAVDDVTVCRFERSAYIAFLSQKPHLMRRLHEATSHELTVAQDHMVLLGRRSAEEKVATFLLSLRERMRRLGASVVTLSLPMSRTDLADHLGLTIETVSRVISKLAREKVLLVVPNGVRLLDSGRLEAIGAS